MTLGPGVLDITGIRAGDRNEFTVNLTINGQPLSLAGYTITAQARNTHADVEMIAAIVTVLDSPAGRVSLRWPGDVIRTWLADKLKATGVWDMQLRPTTGDPTTVVAGAFSAELDVTRP